MNPKVFVLFELFRPTREILHLHGRVADAANFDLCSELMANQQWGFYTVPYLLWHWASVYNGYLWGPVTLTPIVESLAVELSLPFWQLRSGLVFKLVFKHPTFRLKGQRCYPLHHRSDPHEKFYNVIYPYILFHDSFSMFTLNKDLINVQDYNFPLSFQH